MENCGQITWVNYVILDLFETCTPLVWSTLFVKHTFNFDSSRLISVSKSCFNLSSFSVFGFFVISVSGWDDLSRFLFSRSSSSSRVLSRVFSLNQSLDHFRFFVIFTLVWIHLGRVIAILIFHQFPFSLPHFFFFDFFEFSPLVVQV